MNILLLSVPKHARNSIRCCSNVCNNYSVSSSLKTVVVVINYHEHVLLFIFGEWKAHRLKVDNEAEKIGNSAAGCKYDVSNSCVSDWQKKKSLLLGGSCRAFCGQTEEKLRKYISDKRGSTASQFQLKAIEIAKEPSIEHFKVSGGGCC